VLLLKFQIRQKNNYISIHPFKIKKLNEPYLTSGQFYFKSIFPNRFFFKSIFPNRFYFKSIFPNRFYFKSILENRLKFQIGLKIDFSL